MTDINVEICSACAARIKNANLHKFWRILCIGSIAHNSWSPFDPTDHLYDRYISILEEKNFLVTYETPSKTYFKTLGINKDEDDDFLICLRPYEHFKERFSLKN